MRYAWLYNPIISFLLRLGLPLGPQALITVRGRKTGLPRTTPVALSSIDGGWLLVSVYGHVEWVKNLRRAGEALVTRRRRSVPMRSHELLVEEAAPILRDLLASAGFPVRLIVGRYFDADPNASLDVWEDEATRHPVFILTPIDSKYQVPGTEYPVE